MTIAYTLTCRHIANHLLARGWPEDLDVYTHLSYGQGDGIAFYGRLSMADLNRLLPAVQERGHLKKAEVETFSQQARDSEFTVHLTKNSLAGYCAHAGTIDLNYENEPEGLNEDTIRTLMNGLREEINEVCAELKKSGYKIQEAVWPIGNPTVITRKTRNFEVIVMEIEPSEDNSYGWDHEQQDLIIDSILSTGASYRMLDVLIVSTKTSQVLGRGYIDHVLRLPGEPTHKWFDRGALKHATHEARVNIRQLLNAFASFQQVV